MECWSHLGKKLNKFYTLLWLNWILRVTLESIVGALFLASIITFYVYYNQGTPRLTQEINQALFDVFKFWTPILWNVSLLVTLFRSLKHIFNSCHSGYVLRLYSCPKEEFSERIELVGYGDLFKVWRKWLMLIIWLVGIQMILALVFTKFFTSYNEIFDWFNIYVLYVFVLSSGYVSFVLLGSRCKKVKVKKC